MLRGLGNILLIAGLIIWFPTYLVSTHSYDKFLYYLSTVGLIMAAEGIIMYCIGGFNLEDPQQV